MRSARHPRHGYTMVELMAVITIIALLISISAVVMGNMISSAREHATRATIQKIDGLVRQRQEAFQRAMERAELDSAVKQMKQIASQIFTTKDVNNMESASSRYWEVLTRKFFFRSRFPQSFAEIQGGPSPLSLSPIQPYKSLIFDGGLSGVDLSKHSAATESSELLYLILTRGEIYGVPPVGQDEFSSLEVADTDGDGLLEFVDGWQQPLRFYRWPTRLIRPDNSSSPPTAVGNVPAATPTYAKLLIGTLPADNQSLNRDPDDPSGLIYRSFINRSTTFSQTLQTFETVFHTPETYHTFLIVSAGADGDLGLYEPTVINSGDNVYGNLAKPSTLVSDLSESALVDNITNRLQK